MHRFTLTLDDKWWVLIAVTLGMFMSMLDHTIVNVAVPQLQRVFDADLAQIQWVTTIYMITQAVVIPTAPYLTRRLGGKRAYTWSLAAFLVGSVLCGFAWNLPSLIAFRLLQGIGGGTLLPMVMTLLYGAFPIKERSMAVAAMGIPLMVAPLLGPVLGGVLVTYWGWPWTFFINIPLGLVALGIAQRVIKADDGNREARFDGIGFLSAALGSAALLYGVGAAGEGHSGGSTLVFLLLGGLGLTAFVLIEKARTRQDKAVLLDLRRFSDRVFALSNLTNVLVCVARYGILFLLPVYLQALRGQSAAQAGGVLAVQAAATLIVLPLAGRLSSRIGLRTVALAGLGLFALGTALLLTLSLTLPLWAILSIFAVLGCAFALTQQLPVVAMSQIDRHESAEIANGSTLVTVLHATAAPLGVAVLSSLVALRTPQHTLALAAQGVTGVMLDRQSSLAAMHESFMLALGLTLVAVVVMSLVPKLLMPEESGNVTRPETVVG